MTRGMRHSRNQQGGKAVPGFARAVRGGIGAAVLAAFLASPVPAAGFSPDWDRDARNGSAVPVWGAVPAWIVAVAERILPALEPGKPELLEPGKPELVRLAAATVPDRVLAELRGGFVTVGGLEIDIGFDFRTFINGALVVHDVLNPTGPVGGAVGGSSPSTVVTLVSNGNGVTQVINDILSRGGGGSDGGGLPDVISNVTTSDGGGPLNVVTTITLNDGGALQVINQISGGSVSTTIVNNGSGLDINQINTTTISVLNNVQFFNQIGSGGSLDGSPHISNGLLSALIGVIAR